MDISELVAFDYMKGLCNCGAPAKHENEDRDPKTYNGPTTDPATHSKGCPYRQRVEAWAASKVK